LPVLHPAVTLQSSVIIWSTKVCCLTLSTCRLLEPFWRTSLVGQSNYTVPFLNLPSKGLDASLWNVENSGLSIRAALHPCFDDTFFLIARELQANLHPVRNLVTRVNTICRGSTAKCTDTSELTYVIRKAKQSCIGKRAQLQYPATLPMSIVSSFGCWLTIRSKHKAVSRPCVF